MKIWAAMLVGIAAMAAGEARAQEPVPDTPWKAEVQNAAGVPLSFSFVPRAAEQPSWEIVINPDRSGSYRELTAGAESQPIRVSAAVWQRLQAGETAVRRGHCASKLKGIAQTGTKTLSFVLGPAAPATCTFNYSDDETLNDAANAFLALAEMVQQGARLQRDRRFDRLALDADMDGLLGEIDGGRAVEPGNIAQVLQGIVDDERVIERVRRKAARLLQAAGSPAPAPADPGAAPLKLDRPR